MIVGFIARIFLLHLKMTLVNVSKRSATPFSTNFLLGNEKLLSNLKSNLIVLFNQILHFSKYKKWFSNFIKNSRANNC